MRPCRVSFAYKPENVNIAIYYFVEDVELRPHMNKKRATPRLRFQPWRVHIFSVTQTGTVIQEVFARRLAMRVVILACQNFDWQNGESKPHILTVSDERDVAFINI